MKRILVCGLPRSGSTWISKVLSFNSFVKYLHEPDNERQNLLSFVYKSNLPRFPHLIASDNSPKYKTLFQKAYEGYYMQPYGKISNIIRDLFGLTVDELEQRIKENNELEAHEQTAGIREYLINITIQIASYSKKILSFQSKNYDVILLKSVHCQLALEFLMTHIAIDKVLVIFRHPASIVASHLRMDNNDIWRPFLSQNRLLHETLADFESDIQKLGTPLEKAGAKIGAVYYVLENQKEKLGFDVTMYESLCRDKISGFKQLYQQLDLQWNKQVEDYIRELDTSGEGYSVKRIAERQINKWQEELSKEQIKAIKRGYQIFSPDLEYEF